MRSPARLAATLAILYNLVLYSIAELSRIHPHQDAGFLAAGAAHFLGLIITSVAMVLFAGRSDAGRRGAPPPSGGSRLDTARSVALMAAVILPVLLRFLSPGLWLTDAWFTRLTLFGAGVQCALVINLFFAMAARHRGLWFGLGLSAGIFLVQAGQLAWPATHTTGNTAVEYLSVLYTLSTVFSVALAVVIVASLLFLRRSPLPQPPEAGIPATGQPRHAIVYLFLAAAVFYIMNGMLSDLLFPMVRFNASRQLALLPFLLAIVAPTAGWLLDADFEKWFRRLVPLCSLAFLLTPTLAILGESPATYKFVHTLSALSQSVLFVCITLCVDRLARGSRLFCLFICVPYALRFLSVPAMAAFALLSGDSMGLVIVISLLLAALFHHLLAHVLAGLATPAIALAQPESRQTPVTRAPSTGGPATRRGRTASPGNQSLYSSLFHKFGLTPREEEVAKLLVQGTSSTGIALALHISENTVNTHVKSILRKSDVTTRKAFLAKLLAGDLA